MVKGLEIFREHFKDHAGSFVIIGGTACSVLLEAFELEFRLTKDIDVVLFVEKRSPGFGPAFWDFIRKGGYENRQKGSDKKQFYRFSKPSNPAYPAMIELLSSKPEGIELSPDSRFTPIPLDDEISSLSAILMDGDYYSFLREGAEPVEGLPVLSAERLIPLKAKAHLDYGKRKAEGKHVNEADEKKHKKDVFRLYPLMKLERRVKLPGSIAADMRGFLEEVERNPIDPKQLKIATTSLPEILENLRTIYSL